MEIDALPLSGCYQLTLPHHTDARGEFVKPLHTPTFARHRLTWHFREAYYSTSHAGVIRGMHLQLPPYEHTKLVYCLHGQALDVLVDLRKGPNHGHYCALALDADHPTALYIAPGVAHGFLARTACTLHYLVTHEHVPSHDTGIRYDSFGFDWGYDNPLLSTRDLQLPTLAEFSASYVH